MLACASESTTRILLLWSLASVSARARTSVDLPTPPLAFMTVMALRIEPLEPVARSTTRGPRQRPNEGDFVTAPPDRRNWSAQAAAQGQNHGERKRHRSADHGQHQRGQRLVSAAADWEEQIQVLGK